MSQKRYSPLFWHGLAMLNVMLATGLTRLWWGEVRLTPLLFFTIATAASTLTGGLSPGLLAAVLSWFCFDYFCLPPIFAMDPGSVVLIRLVGLGLVAVGVHIPRAARSRAERQLRRAMAELEERVEARTDQLSVANTKLKEEAAEREKAEDALRRSEQYFRSLIENASDVITVLNRDGRIRYESTSVRRRLGYTREELKGLSRLELAHPDDAPHMQQALEHLIRERGTSVSIEYRVRHRDGSWRIFESIAENRLDDPGMAGIVIASRDITERRRAEKALRESEDRYRAFIAQSSEGIWRCESAQLMPPDCSEEEQLKFFFETAYIAECNDAMARMSGLNCAEEMIGRSVSELLPPTDEKNRELLRSFIRSGYRIVDAETQEQDRDGNPKWFSNTMIGILENGRLARAWGTQLDITRRKLSETALRESETQLRATSKFIQEIIYNAGEGIAVMDHDRRYILWNRVIEEKTGLRAEEILGRRTDEAFPYLKDLGLDQLHDRVLRGETVTAPDLETIRTDGRSFWWSVKYAPHRNAEGEIIGIICLSHDMTERKQAEKQQAELLAREQAARQQAETASRLKDEFLATVSHELRTPLSAIIGWARMLRDGSVSLERVHYALETIERNARVQTQLINDLLDVSRIISGKLLIEPESVDLAAVISAAISTVCPAAEARSIQLEFNPTEQAQVVSGDHDRLQQVVWNLLSNAVKFTPQGGRIVVALAQVETQALISVSDTGQGIPAEFLPYVFDRFSQADSSITRRHSGLGLGLAIVRHLVEIHGGTVGAASPGKDQGTTFTVRLPRLARSSQPPAASSGTRAAHFRQSPVVLGGIKILIVDDDPDTLEVISVALTQHGAAVTTARTSAHALTAVTQLKPDLIVTDIGLPDEDGYALISRVRALGTPQGAQIPVIALTAYASHEDRRQALAAGFQQHLAKPVGADELVMTICQILGREHFPPVAQSAAGGETALTVA